METYLKTLLETESCSLSNMASVVRRKCVFIYSRRSQTAASKTPHRKKTTEDSEYNSTNSLLLKNIINHSLQACKMQFSNTWRGLFSLLTTFMYKQKCSGAQNSRPSRPQRPTTEEEPGRNRKQCSRDPPGGDVSAERVEAQISQRRRKRTNSSNQNGAF